MRSLAVIALLGACAAAPDWVHGPTSFTAEAPPALLGVGAANLKNASLALSTAENRARGAVQTLFARFAAEMMRRYAAESAEDEAVDEQQPVSAQIQTFSVATLRSIAIDAVWKDPESGGVSVLARLDLATVLQNIEAMEALSEPKRARIRRAAEEAFATLSSGATAR